MRPADRQELVACYQLPVREALEHCVVQSACCISFIYRGKVAAMAGVEPETWLGRRGCVWLWTGEVVEQCPIYFLKASRYLLHLFQQQYPLLYAACATNYPAAQRYIKHLGGQAVGNLFLLADQSIYFQLYQFKQLNLKEKEDIWEEQSQEPYLQEEKCYQRPRLY